MHIFEIQQSSMIRKRQYPQVLQEVRELNSQSL